MSPTKMFFDTMSKTGPDNMLLSTWVDDPVTKTGQPPPAPSFVQVTNASVVVAPHVVFQLGWKNPEMPRNILPVHFSMNPLLSTIRLPTLYMCKACQAGVVIS